MATFNVLHNYAAGQRQAESAENLTYGIPDLHSIGSMHRKLAPLAVVVIAAVISVVATAKDLDVPSLWRTCQRDSDCSPITRCGSCCGDDAINKEKIEDYADLYRQECQNARPPCPCYYRKPVCKQGVCELGR